MKKIKEEQYGKEILLISIAISLAIIIETLNFLIFVTIPLINLLLHVISAIIVIIPIFFTFYYKSLIKKNIEENFINFLKDLVESVRGGMNLFLAIQHVKNNNYGKLSQIVKRTANRLSLGMPFENAMRLFAKETNSELISRIINSLIESQNFGGNIIDTMESLADIILEIEKMREERKTFMSSQIITGYIIYFVFIGIIIGLEKFLFPHLTKVQVNTLSTLQTTDIQSLSQPIQQSFSQEEIIVQFSNLLRDLIIIQGIFSGLLIGKMAEGALINGVKHSLILTLIGFFVFFISKII